MTLNPQEQIVRKLCEWNVAAVNMDNKKRFTASWIQDRGLYIFDHLYYNKVSTRDSHFWLTDSMIESILAGTGFDTDLYNALVYIIGVESSFMASLQ
jgi:hypothetical protein